MPIKPNLLALVLCVAGGLATSSNAQPTFYVETNKPWLGWMNVYSISGGSQGSYLWGSAWGTTNLIAVFDGTNTLTLLPNTNTYNPADPYWVNPDGTGAKWMEANFYVDCGTAYGGQTVVFTGEVFSNTLVHPYSAVAFIKEFTPGYGWIGMSIEPLYSESAFTVTRTIGPGNICQYGFMLTGPNANPTNLPNLGKVVIAVQNPALAVLPLANQAVVEGQTAIFTVTAQGTAPFNYRWAHVTATSSNVLANGGRIAGATTHSLTISNVTSADAGAYWVTVWNNAGTNSVWAYLEVIPLEVARTNLLIDPGFEKGAFAPMPDIGWFNFGGAAIQNTNDFYYGSETHVAVVEGTNCCQIYAQAEWNGVFQDRPAAPGEVYTAKAWFLTPAEDKISENNVCFLEVQFRDAADAVLVQYASAMVDANFPANTWVQLMPTNIRAGDFITPLGTADYMVAPPGTAKVRFQITYRSVGGRGSVYVDGAELKLRAPVVAAQRSGTNVVISFPTRYGPQYQLYYKTNLADPAWVPIGTQVQGDGRVKSIQEPVGPGTRFYTVNARY
ncbi:MAG: immunoglobulin domain-containing protein [Verrucomicrobiae bacterium]|nr:immunoglobulin domain-containing protein [Verrucomicrobiae bacterium]MDW7980568.1 immunoglobulin domain-containing protein [Verrucomicrobiales bacterium]